MFWIVSDAANDLPQTYIEKQEKLTILPMSYCVEGKEHQFSGFDEKELHAFYDLLRNGTFVTTSQVSVDAYLKVFRELVRKGEEVLCVAFSSGLSGSYQSAELARKMVLEEYPTAKLSVVDSLCASLGYGLLVHYCLQQRANGKTLDETTAWVNNNRQKIIHWFTVDDLMFLKRGGRVGTTSAFVGSMLKIKPVLHVNYEGKLIPREKVQGRKRSLKALVEKAEEYTVPHDGQTFFISHGDCAEDAQYVAELIKEKFPHHKEIFIAPIGCIIGAHSGPGTVALFFTGSNR